MKTKRLIFVMFCLGLAAAENSPAAVQLSTLPTPTLQTVMNLGAAGVTVGNEQFYNFNFIGSNLSGGPAAASQILIQPITTANGDGLQFVSIWNAANGTAVSDIITYDVAATALAADPAWIDLFTNGTAPAPTAGTFTTTTLTAQTLSGAPAAAILSTFDDGVTVPIDTTRPDVNFAAAAFTPQPALQITDSVFADSTSPSSGNAGGVATLSVIQNTFGSVPEPANLYWFFPPMALLLSSRGRRRKLDQSAEPAAA
jgi:hypothetical protein